MITEDEFVVLLEHSRLVECCPGTEIEYVKKDQILNWLYTEGHTHFRDTLPTIAFNNLAIQPSDTQDNTRSNAENILEHIIHLSWLIPTCHLTLDAFFKVSPALQISKTLYDFFTLQEPGAYLNLRLSTIAAYDIYLNKDEATCDQNEPRRSILLPFKSQENATVSNSNVETSSDANDGVHAKRSEIRASMWQNSFPMCAPGCREIFFSLENKTVILYAVLGLHLIQNGISTVPAFSRELKSILLSASDRSIITGFLAKAFPCEG